MDLYSIRLALQSSTQKWTEMYLFWKNYLHPRTVASTSKGRIQIWQSRLLSHLHNRNPHAYKDGLHIETGAKIQQTSKRKTFVAIVMSSYRDYHSHGRIIQIHDDVIKWKHFRVTGHFCGEFTGHRWIPRTRASDAELWCVHLCLNKWLSK